MQDKRFRELLKSVREGGAILRGEQPAARTFEVPATDVRRMRQAGAAYEPEAFTATLAAVPDKPPMVGDEI